MDASERRASDEVLDATGDDAVEVLARSDGPAREAMTDGGLDVDFREAVARVADGDAIDSSNQLDRAVRKIDELDGPASQRAELLIGKTEGTGLRLVDELDDSALRKVLDSPEIHIDELAAATRKYSELDATKRSQLRDLLTDDDLRASWVRVVSKERVDIEGVKYGLDSVDRIDDVATVDNFHRSY